MSIQENLRDIKYAVYGKDVRRSIHDGIKEINEETKVSLNNSSETRKRQDAVEKQFEDLQKNATDVSPSDVEIVSARTNTVTGEGHPTLVSRLDKENKEVSQWLEREDEVNFKRENNRIKDTHPNAKRRCIVSFVDDDGYNLSFEKLRPILEPLGVPVSMALCPEFTDSGKQITKENIEIAKELGWEFASHTLTHRRLPNLSLEEVDYELRESKRRIEELTKQPIDYFVYPHNHQNYEIRQLVKKYYKFAFYGNNKVVDYPARSMQVERVSMGAFQANSGVPDTLEYYISKVDEAFENDRWIVFMLHAFHEEFDSVQRQHLKDLITYIRGKNIPIKLPSEAWAEMGNMISVGDGDFENFVITNRGEIYGSGKDRENTQMGFLSSVDDQYSSAYGYKAKATGRESTAVGSRSHGSGRNSSAFGDASKSTGDRSLAVGVSAESSADDSVSSGYASKASGKSSSAYGHISRANKDRSTAIGNDALADGTNSTALGVSAKARGDRSIALGVDAETNDTDSSATGHLARASGKSSTANGYRTRAVGDRSTAIGNDALAGDVNTAALGVSARATGPHSVALGKDTRANSFSSIAIGNSARAEDTAAALGNLAAALGQGAVALGDNTEASGANSVALGRGAKATEADEFVLGGTNHRVTIPSRELHMRSPSGHMKIISVTDDGELTVRNP